MKRLILLDARVKLRERKSTLVSVAHEDHAFGKLVASAENPNEIPCFSDQVEAPQYSSADRSAQVELVSRTLTRSIVSRGFIPDVGLSF